MSDDRANQFLTLIRRAQRGRLKVYLGYGPGVGKTTLMLQEGQRLKVDGIDIVIGVVETHGRAGTAKLVEGLEAVPRRISQYHGIAVDEMDLDALLARKPQVALVDELAHTNVPGSRNEKRYQDVDELLAAGIHVISTINVQHLESLYDTVEKQIGIRVRERIPDAVLAMADQVVNVDLAPEDLQKRLESGEIYPKDRIPSAMENYFKASNLEQLRELTLRELAAQIDFRRREVKSQEEVGTPDQIMVCLSSRGPNSARLLRFASRLAGRLNRTWYAVYVQTPTENPLTIDAATQRLLSETLTLANQLGAMVFTFTGADVAKTIIRFAKEYRVGHIVIGKPRPLPWWKRLIGRTSVAEQLISESSGATVVVVDVQWVADHSGEVAVPVPTQAPLHPPAKIAQIPVVTSSILQLLDASLITIWTEPITRNEALKQLVGTIAAKAPQISIEETIARLDARERQGSTFLNEGLALPHARIPGISAPMVALGLTHGGISDLEAPVPIHWVFLLLSPIGESKAHLHLLATAARIFHDRDLRRRLDDCLDPKSAYEEIFRKAE